MFVHRVMNDEKNNEEKDRATEKSSLIGIK